MRSSTYLGLFAGPVVMVVAATTAAVVQSTATVLNFYQFDSTLTVKGSDASATTYEKTCPTSAVDSSAIPSQLDSTITSVSSMASTTPKAPLLRRQDVDSNVACRPYTLMQGLSTWEFHFTHPIPGVWTVDMDCQWQGDMTTADLTCAATQAGSIATANFVGVSVSVLSAQEAQSMEVFQTIAVVTATGASSLGTASDPATKSPTASTSLSPANSTSQAVAHSPARAPAGPIPTGAMVFVGGAAGVLAAALAL